MAFFEPHWDTDFHDVNTYELLPVYFFHQYIGNIYFFQNLSFSSTHHKWLVPGQLTISRMTFFINTGIRWSKYSRWHVLANRGDKPPFAASNAMPPRASKVLRGRRRRRTRRNGARNSAGKHAKFYRFYVVEQHHTRQISWNGIGWQSSEKGEPEVEAWRGQAEQRGGGIHTLPTRSRSDSARVAKKRYLVNTLRLAVMDESAHAYPSQVHGKTQKVGLYSGAQTEQAYHGV